MAVKRSYASISVVEAATIRIKNVFSNGVPVYMSFSGGKDSICMADLVYRLIQKKEIDPKQLTVIFVDDEISTGKTLINIVTQMRSTIPSFKEKRIVAASIINRVSAENLELLDDAGIESAQLLKIENENYDSIVSAFEVNAPADIISTHASGAHLSYSPSTVISDARSGVNINEYTDTLYRLANEVADSISDAIKASNTLLVLGTEECMFPALILGKIISDRNSDCEVFCHATTRSPIGILESEDYPIRNGYRIHSLYDGDRGNFIYNTRAYDTVVLLTDSPNPLECAILDIKNAFSHDGHYNFIEIRGKLNVQHV